MQHANLYIIAGPNGAGKTTTIKMLSGLILPTSGEIIIEDMHYKLDAIIARQSEILKYLSDEK